MDKAKTSKRQKGFSIDNVPIVRPSTKLSTKRHDPDSKLRDLRFIAEALAEAIVKGDKKTFLDVLAAHIKSKNISEMERKTKIKRSTIYAAIDKDANPTLDTIINLIQKSA
jgi:probable addiction module antidote protein